MPDLPKLRYTSSCVCGKVALEASGAPIAIVACHCSDCRAAAGQIEGMPGAAPILDPSGGTAFLLFRKDRMSQAKGAELLSGLKLEASSATSRYVATCCNTMMNLGFDDSKHWVSMNRERFQGDISAVQMRICTGSLQGVTRPTDVPCYPGYPIRFIARLMLARLAMVVGG